MNIFERYGLDLEDQRVLLSWFDPSLAGRGSGPISVDELAAYAAAAFMLGKRQGQLLSPQFPPVPASVPPPPSGGSPLVLQAPPVPASAPLPLMPQGVTLGRSPRGMGPGPLPADGPTPAHVQIGAGGARVQIHDPNAPPAVGPQQIAGPYTGNLQPGQTRVEIALPTGETLPPVFKDPDGKVKGATPAALVPSHTAAAPGTLAGAMESVRMAGQIGPKQIAALDAIEAGEDSPQTPILLALGLVELAAGELALTQAGREARQIARNRLEGAPGGSPG